MRISGPNANGAVTTARAPRQSAAATFTLNEGEGSRSAAATTGLRTLAGIDTLIALQGLEDATERRKQAFKRGKVALDVLEELKIVLLGGALTGATLSRLRSIVGPLAAGSGDAGLDAVLAEIGLRVEVEIAKIAAR